AVEAGERCLTILRSLDEPIDGQRLAVALTLVGQAELAAEQPEAAVRLLEEAHGLVSDPLEQLALLQLLAASYRAAGHEEAAAQAQEKIKTAVGPQIESLLA